MKKKVILGVLIAALLWYILGTRVDFGRSIVLIREMDMQTLIICAAIFVLTQVVKALRFQVLLNEKALSFRHMFAVAAIHNFLNQLMPAKTGEGSYPLLLKKSGGVEYSRSIASLVLGRSYDLLSISLFYSAFLAPLASGSSVLWLSWSGLVVLQIALFVFFLRYLEGLLTCITKCLVKMAGLLRLKAEWAGKISRSLSGMISDLGTIKTDLNHFKVMFYSLSIWFLIFSIFYVVVNNFDKKIDFAHAVLGSAGVVAVSLIPVIVLGNFGIVEAGWTAGYALAGMNKEAAFASGLLLHAVMFCFGFLLFLLGLVMLKRYSKNRTGGKGKPLMAGSVDQTRKNVF